MMTRSHLITPIVLIKTCRDRRLRRLPLCRNYLEHDFTLKVRPFEVRHRLLHTHDPFRPEATSFETEPATLLRRLPLQYVIVAATRPIVLSLAPAKTSAWVAEGSSYVTV